MNKLVVYNFVICYSLIRILIQTTAHNILLDRDLVESIDGPRVHQQLWPDEVLYEDNFNRVNKLGVFFQIF